MRVSIIITNRNYAEFLGEAIESAIGQPWPDKEIIVVDDGSTDGSREVIERYAGSVMSIWQTNAGQCSAMNVGFAACRGDAVIFLDSDDYLLDGAVAVLVVPLVEDRSVARSQGYMRVVDRHGRPTGRVIPRRLSPTGDYLEQTLREGPGACRHAFTSGNAWARWFLCEVMPIPALDDIGVDACLSAVSTLFGRTVSVPDHVAAYRVHGRNKGPTSRTFSAESLRLFMRRIECTRRYLAEWAERLGHSVQHETWRRHGGGWRLALADHSIARIEGRDPPIGFGELVLAPLKAGHARRSKAIVVCLMLAIVWVLPRRAALAAARQMLQLPRPVA